MHSVHAILLASPEQWLDSSRTLYKFTFTDSDSKEYWGNQHHTKTDVVVVVVARVSVAIGRATIRRIVVPRTH